MMRDNKNDCNNNQTNTPKSIQHETQNLKTDVTKLEDNSKLKKAFKKLTNTIWIIGFGLFAYCIFNAFSKETFEFLPLVNIFTFFAGFAILMYTAIIVAIIWIIYDIIKNHNK